MGIAKRTAQAIEDSFGLRTAGDLLRHYPRRYYTRGELTDLASLADAFARRSSVPRVDLLSPARVIFRKQRRGLC